MVDLVLRMNFKHVMPIFNIVFICLVGIIITSCKSKRLFHPKGAAKTQCGFIVNKIQLLAREYTVHVCDLLLILIIDIFK